MACASSASSMNPDVNDFFYNPAGYEWEHFQEIINVSASEEEAWTGDEVFGQRTSHTPITWLEVCKAPHVAIQSTRPTDKSARAPKNGTKGCRPS